MTQRHLSNPFTISGIEQHDNHHLPIEQSHVPIGRAVAAENGTSVGPMDHMLRGGVRFDSRWSLEGRANGYPSSTIGMEVQRFAPVFSGPQVDPYRHSSATGNTSLAPMTPVGHVHSSHYNAPSIREAQGGLLNSTTGIRGPFKRKHPDISGSWERGSSSNLYRAGSSSNSSQMLVEKRAVDCHSAPPYRGAGLSIAGEDSMRNVRSRSRLELEPSMARNQVPSHSSHFHQLTTRPASYSAPFHPANLNADATSRERNCVPRYAAASHGRISPSDINGSRHETSQFHVGGSSADIDACHHDSVFRRHPVSSSRYFHDLHAQPTREGHSNHSRRVTPPYRSGPSYSHNAHGGASSTNGLHSPLDSFPTRYSRHCSAGGWLGSYRSTRSRMAVERLQPIVDVMDARDGIRNETIMTADRASSFYGSSRNLFDQHIDMRLDIDSMSYEELLALEERIGDVSTGLSEDSLPKCLREKVHCSSDQNHDDCPICLEEYENGDNVGTMAKCGHSYHVDCIKKWLSMKKICPVCKSECSTQEPNKA